MIRGVVGKSHMRRVKRLLVRDFTTQEIGRFTRSIRKMLGRHDQKAQNLLIFFEDLRKIFPRLRMRIVEDAELPKAEAQAYPIYWIIKIRRGVYEGLLRGDKGARWTFAHELGHVLLQHPGRPHRQRVDSSNDVVEQRRTCLRLNYLLLPILQGNAPLRKLSPVRFN